MIFEKLVAVLADHVDCDPSSVTMDTTFEELGVDSLDTVDMVMELEIQTMQPGERLYAYRQSTQLAGHRRRNGQIGGRKNGREGISDDQDTNLRNAGN